jgi:phosphate transport system ATP-binding protein
MLADGFVEAVRRPGTGSCVGCDEHSEIQEARPMAHSEKMSVRDLHLYYGEFHALKGVSIPLKERQITALIGPSGCGKSTFLRCLNRMNDTIKEARVTGEVLLDGQDVYAPGFDVVDLRQRVGMVFQRPNPFPQSVYANVAFGPRVLGMHKTRSLDDLVRASLEGAALWDEVRGNLKASALDLNAGQQQRLCIARVLAVQPEVILMDEPCSALDPVDTLAVEDLMRRLEQEYTIVIVTHNMQQAARASDWTGFFWLGDLVEYGPTEQVFTKPAQGLTEDYITGRAG